MGGGPDRPLLRDGATGAYLKMPPKPPVEFRHGAEQTRGICGEGYFTCHGKSKMCEEEAKTWEPMDTTPMRKMWINCTAAMCRKLGLAPYAPRCAGAMLHTWTTLWRHAPVAANSSLSLEMSRDGALDGSALGWYDPAHATATLASLAKQAHEMVSGTSRDGGLAAPRVKDVIQECSATQRAELRRMGAKEFIHGKGRRLAVDWEAAAQL